MARDRVRAHINECDSCGGRTVGLTISTQGGTRVLSQGTRSSKGIYCRACGTTRIHALNAQDARRAERRRNASG